jgi:hypothetical protein
VDTQLELAKIDATPNLASQVAGSGILTVSKQKDGETGVKIGFEMVKVEIKGSALGIADAQISLAVRASDEALQQQETARKAKRQSNTWNPTTNQRLGLKTLHDALKKNGHRTNINDQNHKTVSEDEWKAEYGIYMSKKRQWTNTFDVMVTQLVGRDAIGKHVTPVATYVWAVYQFDDNDKPFVAKD